MVKLLSAVCATEMNVFLVQVRDTGIGIGIPAAKITGIFDRFKKSSGTTDENFGLGLSIVKSIAVYHNWNIAVHSNGRGAVFSCIIQQN